MKLHKEISDNTSKLIKTFWGIVVKVVANAQFGLDTTVVRAVIEKPDPVNPSSLFLRKDGNKTIGSPEFQESICSTEPEVQVRRRSHLPCQRKMQSPLDRQGVRV